MKSDFYSERTVKGRRDYSCQMCLRTIAKGAAHVSVSSCNGGKYHAHRAHVDCHEAATGQTAPAPALGRLAAALT